MTTTKIETVTLTETIHTATGDSEQTRAVRVEMPEDYDAAQVTAEDIRQDAALRIVDEDPTETMIASARADGYEDGLDGTADADAYDPSEAGIPPHLWEAARLAYAAGAAEGETASRYTASVLASAKGSDTWTVADAEGGRWWPSREAHAEIEHATDPAVAAIRICTSEPMRGRWVD